MKPYYEDKTSGITIYHGDCREVMATFGEGWSRPIIITDPPYLTDDAKVPIIGGGVGPRINETKSVGMPWGYSLEWVGVAATLHPLHWVVYCNYRMLGGIQEAVEKHAKLQCTFVWRKENAPRMTRPVPRLDCEFILWLRHPKASCGRMGLFESMVLDVPMPQAGCFATERILEPGTGSAAHPCQKPLAVVTPFVDRLADAGDYILDPYMGTGTTLVAAKLASVRAIGIDIHESYCEIAARRLAQGILFGAKESA